MKDPCNNNRELRELGKQENREEHHVINRGLTFTRLGMRHQKGLSWITKLRNALQSSENKTRGQGHQAHRGLFLFPQHLPPLLLSLPRTSPSLPIPNSTSVA